MISILTLVLKFHARSQVLLSIGLLMGLVLNNKPSLAQTMENQAVRASAVVQKNPAQITLNWTADKDAQSYYIYKKLKEEDFTKFTMIGSIKTNAAAAASYIDKAVTTGIAYEYNIIKSYLSSSTAYGSVLSGIEVPAIEFRGKLLLIVQDTHAEALNTELQQLQEDLVGDGWQVIRHDIGAKQTPPQVRALIQTDYQAAPTQVKAVLLVGNVPVPYSGSLFPDGHTDHKGAWPADGYYGDMDGEWTDVNVSVNSAARTANHNVPGDGKFDQSYFPSDLELQVGRIDLSNMPAFKASEVELLRRYLNKDHQYRHKVFTVKERALIDDVFGPSKDFANNGWRNFSVMVGASQTSDADYFSTLRTNDYLLAFAGGGGTYTSASDVGSTADFANGSVKSVFNMAFGSYFGDWDNQNNFLRAVIAAEGYTLTSCWAGRPNWHVHHMAMGETIGYGTILSQNSGYIGYTSGSKANSHSQQVHIALMGDPTLRLHPMYPASNPTITTKSGVTTIKWTASTDAGLGYYVYRAASMDGEFIRLTKEPISATSIIDAAPLAGENIYMIRAARLQQSASGSYINLSQGVFASFTYPDIPLSSNPISKTISSVTTSAEPGQPVTVELIVQAPTTVNLQMFDVVGRSCWQASYHAQVGLNRLVAPQTTSAAGMYFLTVDCGSGCGVQYQRILRE
ncbi:MAG TPA: C25 family cysteine peptidase [Cytophagaceae bacterium]|jgi:hypothetical protein